MCATQICNSLLHYIIMQFHFTVICSHYCSPSSHLSRARFHSQCGRTEEIELNIVYTTRGPPPLLQQNNILRCAGNKPPSFEPSPRRKWKLNGPLRAFIGEALHGDCLWKIGKFTSFFCSMIGQSYLDKTVFTLKVSPLVAMHIDR